MAARPSLDDLLSGVPPEKLSQPCSDEHLCEIALSITGWQTIAPLLGLSEVAEEEVVCKYPKQLLRQNIEMLRKWRESHGSTATYQELVKVFWHVGKTTLVKQVCSLLVSPKTKILCVPEDLPGSSATCHDIDLTPPASKKSRISSLNSSEMEPVPETLGEPLQTDEAASEHGCKSLQRVVLKAPPLIFFSGPLATTRFQKVDRAFCRAVHAGKAEEIEWATEKMLSMNVSADYKAIALLYRASCKAVITGQLDGALIDCDLAIERAKHDCENSSLIIGRALRKKTSILRTVGKCDEALECASAAKAEYFLAAPSYDTAALLYEEVKLKMEIATSKGAVVNFSEINKDYDRILSHSDYLCDDDRPALCIFINANAEAFLRSMYIEDELPPTAIAPTENDLRRAEELLNDVPLKVLPGESYVYRGWHYKARSELCMWRKQYPKAIEWAEKSQDQFTRGGVTGVKKPQELITLYKKLQALEIQESNELDEIVDQLSA